MGVSSFFISKRSVGSSEQHQYDVSSLTKKWVLNRTYDSNYNPYFVYFSHTFLHNEYITPKDRSRSIHRIVQTFTVRINLEGRPPFPSRTPERMTEQVYTPSYPSSPVPLNFQQSSVCSFYLSRINK